MERINLPGRPTALSPMDACIDYQTGEIFARVILEVEVKDSDFVVWAQAYQMTADGHNVRAPKGYPSRSARTPHTIPKDAITYGIKTWVPGWIQMVPPPGVVYSPESLPEGAAVADVRPLNGMIGQMTYVEPFLYLYSPGVLREIAEVKVGDLLAVIASSDVLSGIGFDQSLL